jgi:RNase P/RNase MRP subunit p29
MKRFILTLAVAIMAGVLSALAGATFDLRLTDLGGHKIQVLATNIPSGIRGYCVFETSSNLVTWTPAVTNFVNKTWSTNTFYTTNSTRFIRAWVY